MFLDFFQKFFWIFSRNYILVIFFLTFCLILTLSEFNATEIFKLKYYYMFYSMTNHFLKKDAKYSYKMQKDLQSNICINFYTTLIYYIFCKRTNSFLINDVKYSYTMQKIYNIYIGINFYTTLILLCSELGL